MTDGELEARLRVHLSAHNVDAPALTRVEAFVARREFLQRRGRAGRGPILATVVGVALVPAAVVLAVHLAGTPHPAGGSLVVGIPTPTASPASPTATPVAPSPAGTPTATPVATPSTGAGMVVVPRRLASLQMVDAQDGWALDSGTATAGGGTVVRTTDGGRTWRNVTPSSAPLQFGPSITALDARHAWVSTGSTPWVSAGSTVLRTADGGATWQASQLPSTDIAGDLDAVDASNLFSVTIGHATMSSNVSIVGSTDGGATWHLVSATPPADGQGPGTGLPFRCNKNGIGWRDARTGWATGNCYGLDAFFDVTHDGGVTWASAAIPIPPSGIPPSGGAFIVHPPVFSSPTVGALAVEDVAAGGAFWYVYSTVDGGATWTYSNRSPAATVLVTPTRVGVTLAIAGDGSFAVSSDGGRTWRTTRAHPELASASAAQQTIAAIDERTWFVVEQPVASSGAPTTNLYVTTDGGATLTRLQP
jgi:photosystem II stability/assembly factor-like uncharacterized protein